jgi:hypothetical protein
MRFGTLQNLPILAEVPGLLVGVEEEGFIKGQSLGLPTRVLKQGARLQAADGSIISVRFVMMDGVPVEIQLYDEATSVEVQLENAQLVGCKRLHGGSVGLDAAYMFARFAMERRRNKLAAAYAQHFGLDPAAIRAMAIKMRQTVSPGTTPIPEDPELAIQIAEEVIIVFFTTHIFELRDLLEDIPDALVLLAQTGQLDEPVEQLDAQFMSWSGLSSQQMTPQVHGEALGTIISILALMIVAGIKF